MTKNDYILYLQKGVMYMKISSFELILEAIYEILMAEDMLFNIDA